MRGRPKVPPRAKKSARRLWSFPHRANPAAPRSAAVRSAHIRDDIGSSCSSAFGARALQPRLPLDRPGPSGPPAGSVVTRRHRQWPEHSSPFPPQPRSGVVLRRGQLQPVQRDDGQPQRVGPVTASQRRPWLFSTAASTSACFPFTSAAASAACYRLSVTLTLASALLSLALSTPAACGPRDEENSLTAFMSDCLLLPAKQSRS